MIGQLKSLGIEKGKPFRPDPKTKERLESSARRRTPGSTRWRRAFRLAYFEATQWALPASSQVVKEVVEGMSTGFAKPESDAVHGRDITSSIADICVKDLAAGQLYLMVS